MKDRGGREIDRQTGRQTKNERKSTATEKDREWKKKSIYIDRCMFEERKREREKEKERRWIERVRQTIRQTDKSHRKKDFAEA